MGVEENRAGPSFPQNFGSTPIVMRGTPVSAVGDGDSRRAPAPPRFSGRASSWTPQAPPRQRWGPSAHISQGWSCTAGTHPALGSGDGAAEGDLASQAPRLRPAQTYTQVSPQLSTLRPMVTVRPAFPRSSEIQAHFWFLSVKHVSVVTLMLLGKIRRQR